MCGIAGIALADAARVPGPAPLARAAAALRHRGPDGEGFHRAPGVGLAVRRLAIVAPHAGDQPIASEDGTVVLVCNGEIYDAPEHRRALAARGHRFATASDVEVVVHLYEEEGVDCLARLRGMFALALWDARAGRLLLARDGFGIKPLVWAETPEGIAFASEAKALLAAGWVDPAIDPAAVDTLFRFGYVVSPRTMFAGVRALLPGHRIVVEKGRARVERWWEIPFPPAGARPARTAAEWAGGLRERLEESVALHLRADVPVAAWLSGGVDSSAVAALAARAQGSLDVVTLAFEDARLDETSGGTLARDETFPLRERRATLSDADFALLPRALWHTESPTTSALEIPRWILSRTTAQGFRAALSGEGADELLGGYWWYALDRRVRPLGRLPRPARSALARGIAAARRPWLAGAVRAAGDPPLARFERMTGPRDAARRARLYAPAFRSRVAEEVARGPGPEDAVTGPAPADPFEALQHAEMHTRLPDFIEHRLDGLSMAHGLEIRVPFLDREVAAWALAVPPDLRQKGRTEKHVLREAMRGVLPDALRLRKKRGLAAPFRRWLKGPLPEFAAALLSPAAVERAGIFDPAEIEGRLARHRGGAADASESVMGALAVQAWSAVYLERRDPGEPPS